MCFSFFVVGKPDEGNMLVPVNIINARLRPINSSSEAHTILLRDKAVSTYFRSNCATRMLATWRGSVSGRVRGHTPPDIPQVLAAHSSTGEIDLLTIEINREHMCIRKQDCRPLRFPVLRCC